MAFRILFVCTGNICRSPLAERLLVARLGRREDVAVCSAGTAALSGWAIDAPSARALRERGGDPANHVARQLTAELVAAADLVLTATVTHRSAVLRLEPLAFRRTFTMREFARLGTGLPPRAAPADESGLRERVSEVAARRGVAEPAEPGADDIGDPFGAPIDRAREVAGQLAVAVGSLAAALGIHAADEPRTV